MKNLKFKSLTMRIWTTFTAIILIIICSISILYVVTFKRMNESARKNDLKVAHNIIINNMSTNQPLNQFDEMRNLKGSDFFIYHIDENNKTEIIKINKGKVPPPNGLLPAFAGEDDEVRMWMCSFINSDNIYGKQFSKVYKNKRFYFIISKMKYSGNEILNVIRNESRSEVNRDGNNNGGNLSNGSTGSSSNINSNSSIKTETGKYYLITFMPNVQDNNLLYMVVIIGLVFIGIGFLTAKVVAYYIARPLRELEEFTVRISHKDFSEQISIANQDEIGRLAAAMNLMQLELKHADEEEKTFLQSISHDLKTPVMVIMSHAEAIIDGVYIDSVEKTAEIIKTEAISLEKKIKQMLYLNTLDYVLLNKNENEKIAMNELLHSIINRFEAVNSEIEWELNIEKLTLFGNEDKIKVAIENIIDNALRYAEEKIAISLKKEDSNIIVEIYNDGPNIDNKSIDHIFDNLYKGKNGKFGLGLAISKKIVDFHNGKIEALNRDNGISFILQFPDSRMEQE